MDNDNKILLGIGLWAGVLVTASLVYAVYDHEKHDAATGVCYRATTTEEKE